MDDRYYKSLEPLFGEWRIERQIGEGSFGKVYEITRKDFGRTYRAALKAITIPQNESEFKSIIAEGMDVKSATTYYRSFVEELVDEFALMSKLKGNSNIVSYEDHKVIEHTNGMGWDILIRMELLRPLNDHVAEKGMTEHDIVKLGIDICKALEICQRHHIIHRDIKPENIFVSETGDYKLGDFGIARTAEKTTSGLSKKGTYIYMAPEVYLNEEYGPRIDIYSLGIVLYRMLNNNRAPFYPPYPETITYEKKELAISRRISGERIPLPAHGNNQLTDVILKACAYQATERFSSAAEMRTALEQFLPKIDNSEIICRNDNNDFVFPENEDTFLEDEEDDTESQFGKKEHNTERSTIDTESTESLFGEKNVGSSSIETSRIMHSKKWAIGITLLIVSLILIGIIHHLREGTPKEEETIDTIESFVDNSAEQIAGKESQGEPKLIDEEPLFIERESISLCSGDTEKIAVSGGNGYYSWSSSNESIVSVDSKGVIIANQEGVAIITVQSSTCSESCAVTVTKRNATINAIETQYSNEERKEDINVVPSTSNAIEPEPTTENYVGILTGKTNVDCGETITLFLQLGEYDVYGFSCTLSYDKEIEFIRYGCTGKDWTLECCGLEFKASGGTSAKGQRILKLEFTINDILSAGTTVSVALNNVSIFDGNNNIDIGTLTWNGYIQ